MSKAEDVTTCHRCLAAFDKPTIQLLTKGPHYAKSSCPICGYCFGFVAKPQTVEKHEKRPEKITPEDIGIGYCQMCLRKENQLGKGWLCVHHIDDDPTNNDRLNLQVVCIACHKIVTWLRTYFLGHLNV